MADVFIDSGPVEATNLLRHVPGHRWRELMLARRRFVENALTYDCRCLVQFVNDAKLMFSDLGFPSAEAMIREGYGLEPDDIADAVRWLERNSPADSMSLDEVKVLATHGGAREGAGRPSKGETRETKADNQVGNTHLKSNGSIERTLARLDRDGLTDLAARVRAGEISAYAAAIEAGFRKRTINLPDDLGAAIAALVRRYGHAAVMYALSKKEDAP